MRFAYACAFLSSLSLLLTGCTDDTKYFVFRGFAQGGTYSVKANLADVGKNPEAIQKGIDSILYVIDTTLSGYNKLSILSRFNRGEKVVPNKMFIEMYDMAYGYWEETGGALDCAGGPLYDAWGFGFTSDSLPSPRKVDSLLGISGMKRLVPKMEDVLDEDGTLSPAALLKPEFSDGPLPELNYNAIAQGYSCDVVATYLKGLGVKDMLVDIGEIFCNGINPDGRPWTIGVDRPYDGNETPGKDLDGIWESDGKPHGIVTSGNYRKFYVKDGKKYSHTIDPRSGYPVSHGLLSATVTAASGARADAMATYCMVIGLDSAKSFIESDPGLEAWLIYTTPPDTTMRTWPSAGFNLK
jgi:thiamine biosynthesis lipoprotein